MSIFGSKVWGGTITLANGNPVATFAGFVPSMQDILEGDILLCDGKQMTILDLDDDSITLDLPWPGGAITASANFKIERSSPSRMLPLEAILVDGDARARQRLIAENAVVYRVIDQVGEPPVTPSDGDRYLVTDPAVALSAFEGHENQIALFNLGAWAFRDPEPGDLASFETEDYLLKFNSTAWVLASATAAADITFTPAGNIAATNVQAAIQELDTEKLGKAGGTMTGAIVLPGNPANALEAAPKQYVDSIIAAQDAMVFKGVIDCSANPNYPAADRGHTYRVSVAGKIGGGSGLNVEVGDLIICLTDSTAAGNQATVGASWTLSQTNLDGAVIGPASVTDGRFALFDGTTGKLIKQSAAAPGDAAYKNTGTTAGTLAAGDDARFTPGREKLAANRTYYVRTDGSDSNTGLVNSAGGAFLTLQKAYDVIAATLDLGGYTVTIQVVAGTYATGIVFTQPWVGGGGIIVKGDISTPANVIISTNAADKHCFNVRCVVAGTLRIEGFKLIGAGAGSDGVVNYGVGTVTLGAMEYGAINRFQVSALAPGATVSMDTAYTISGSTSAHMLTNAGGYITFNAACTLTGTPAFSAAFAYATRLGITEVAGGSYTGSASAGTPKYNANLNGAILASGLTFPGGTAGATSTGGQYSA